jgi:hypothetical protein
MVICRTHLAELSEMSTPRENYHEGYDIRLIPDEVVAFWGDRCLMCGVDASPGRACMNDDCRAPLHPKWPAVYCCNLCAMKDV